MTFLEDYALMGAIGLPIALVALGNIYLALTGESGTLLLPSPSRLGKLLAASVEEEPSETPRSGEA
jgi:hypothetical protein